MVLTASSHNLQKFAIWNLQCWTHFKFQFGPFWTINEIINFKFNICNNLQFEISIWNFIQNSHLDFEMDLKFAIVQIASKIDIKNDISKKKWMQWRFDIKTATPATELFRQLILFIPVALERLTRFRTRPICWSRYFEKRN